MLLVTPLRPLATGHMARSAWTAKRAREARSGSPLAWRGHPRTTSPRRPPTGFWPASEDPTKRWKFRAGDLDERARWDQYQAAFEEAIANTSTDGAPWFVIPADRKWYRNWAAIRILIDVLEEMAPHYPKGEVSDLVFE